MAGCELVVGVSADSNNSARSLFSACGERITFDGAGGSVGHRDGYQAGYADAVKAVEVGKPAAAQEAVAWQVGDEFYTSESLAIEGIQQWGPSGAIAIPLYAAPVAAAPVDPSKLGAAMRAFDDAGGHAISYAPAWMQKALEAASTLAAPEPSYLEYLDLQNHSLRRAIHAMMAKLVFLLDEDQFADIDAIALAAGVTPAAPGIDLAPRPMDSAPTDGTMVRLLVQFEDHATEDTEGPAWTIGACNDDNVGDDERVGWQFAGWCWDHDHFTEGKGTPVGWLPLIDASPQGGSDLAAVVMEMEHPAVDLLEAPAPDVIRKWAKRIKQATSAEVGS